MQTFRFKTRMQSLNSIEATSRAKLNFLDQLYRFHGQGGTPFIPPKIAHKHLDVWVLRKEVHKRGGYQHVRPIVPSLELRLTRTSVFQGHAQSAVG
jgi:[histone H3]-trimethyl-L-lysine4 demethylase